MQTSGERLTPSHACKKGRRYRYYVSRFLVTGTAEDKGRGWRIPAQDQENAVARIAADMLEDRRTLSEALTGTGMGIAALPACLARAADLCQKVAAERADPVLLCQAIERVEIVEDGLAVTLSLATIVATEGSEPTAPSITRMVPMSIQRRGIEMRLVIPVAMSVSKADPALTKSIARARSWWGELVSGAQPSIAAIAKRESISEGYVGHLLPLAFLAPSIVAAIVAGLHPIDLTADALIKRMDLPLSWDDQRKLIGCG